MTTTPDFIAQLDAIHVDIVALLRMPAAQLTRQPAPNRWSAVQCVEHVILTNRAYFAPIQRSTEEALARGDAAKRPFRYSIIERWLIWATEPPSRIRLPVPSPAVVPPSTLDVETVRQAYEAEYTDFRRCIQEALAADLRRAKMRSPFIRWATFNIGIAIGVLLAHERRHIAQARTATTTP